MQRGAPFLAWMLSAWVGGAALLFAASVFLFPDLPKLPIGYLTHTLIQGGVRLLPVGFALGIIATVLALLLRRKWPRARNPILGLSAGLVCASLLVPLVAVPVVTGTLGSGLGVILTLIALLLAGLAGLWLTRRASGRRWAAFALLFACTPLWLSGLSRLAPSAPRPGTALTCAAGQRVVLLGLDGATWSMMRPMIDRGELPNIAALMQRGVHAPLRSLDPMLSNSIWTSAATGVLPERHGITDYYFDRRSIQVPTIWDLVHERGGRVGLSEYLVTDPPVAVNGFVLPGWMALDPTRTHPPKLYHRLQYLAALHDPWSTLSYVVRRDRTDPRRNLKEFAKAEFKTSTFLDLYARFTPELAACVWYGTDRLGHKLWRYLEPEAFAERLPDGTAEIAGVLPDYYREADRQIGRVVDAFDKDRTLFLLMSDHGMGPMESVRFTAFPSGRQILQALGLWDAFYVESPHSEMILNCRLEGRSQNWTVPSSKHRQAVESAAERLRTVRRTNSGAPLFEVTLLDLKKGDLQIRVSDPASLSPSTPVTFDGRTVPLSALVTLVELSGSHRMDGILVLAGPQIRAGTALRDPVVLDVAPTILRALGFPIAEDLDGRALEEAFSDSWRAAHPVRTVASYETADKSAPEPFAPSEELIEKLRSLGYVK